MILETYERYGKWYWKTKTGQESIPYDTKEAAQKELLEYCDVATEPLFFLKREKNLIHRALKFYILSTCDIGWLAENREATDLYMKFFATEDEGLT